MGQGDGRGWKNQRTVHGIGVSVGVGAVGLGVRVGRFVREGVSVIDGVRLNVAVGDKVAVSVGVALGGSVGVAVGGSSLGVSVIGTLVGVSVGVALGKIAPGVPGAMVISLSNFGGAGGALLQAVTASTSAQQKNR